MPTLLGGTSIAENGDEYKVLLDRGQPNPGTGAFRDIQMVSISEKITPISRDVDAQISTTRYDVTYLVENQEQESILLAMVGQPELLYRLRIVKNDNLDWVGFVLMELGAFEDERFPYEYKISATDGISRLKKIDYATDLNLEYATFKEHLFSVLSRIPLDDYYQAGDEYLAMHFTFLPEGLSPSSTSTFDLLRVGYKSLRTVDRKGELKYLSAYKVLVEILQAFNLRLIYTRGRYFIVELGDYLRDDGQVQFFRYDIDGQQLSTTTLPDWSSYTDIVGDNQALANNTAQAIILAGARNTYVPPLLKVDLLYKHFSRQNLFTQTLPGGIAPSIAEIPNFRTEEGAGRLRITARLRGTFQGTSSQAPPSGGYIYSYRARVAIVDPDDILNGDALSRSVTVSSSGFTYGNPVWEDGNLFDSAYEFRSYIPAPTDELTFTLPIEVLTPPVPSSGLLQVSFAAQSIMQLVPISWVVVDLFVESLLDGTIEGQYDTTSYIANNNTALQNSVVLEPKVIFGDGPGRNTFGHIEYFDGTEWQVTDGWRRHDGNDYLDEDQLQHGQLLAQRILAIQAKTRPILNASMIARSYSPDMIMLRGTGIYIPQDITNDKLAGIWSGKWIQLDTIPVELEDPTIVITENTTINPSPSDFAPLADPNGGRPGPPPGIDQAGLNTIPTVLNTDIPAGQPIDVINLQEGPEDVSISAGDVLIITDPITGLTQEVTVAIDYELGNPETWTDPNGLDWTTPDGQTWIVNPGTGLSVEQFTPAFDIPSGSYVQIEPSYQTQLNALLRTDYVEFDLFPSDQPITNGTTTLFWRPFRRIGYKIKGVIFGFASDSGGGCTISVTQSNVNNTVSIATFELQSGGSENRLGGFVAAQALVSQGIYQIEISNISGTPHQGLQVTLELEKRIV
ncbi:MAG: hypothetical protein AAF741_14115 [Bacteroidota bacterium]